MCKPLVTIFIAAYNAEKYIKECVESIINQTYKNLDILIIDDGSIDNTWNIINNIKDNRIRVFKNETNKGLPYTRNRGLELCKGEYFAIIDADDIAVNTRIEKQVDFLENNLDIDVVTSNYTVFNGKLSKNIKINKDSERIKASLIFGCTLCNSTAMIRRDSLIKFNIKYNSNCFIAQDYEMWCQFSKNGKIYNIDESLIKYRIGHENITKKTKLNKRLKRKKVINSIQNDILSFYKFDLNKNDKELFFDFFTDNYNNNLLKTDDYYNNIKNLLDKLIDFNKKNNIFNESVFIDEINFATKHRIFNLNINLLKKIKLYTLLINEDKIINILSDINKIILKNLQYIINLKST